MKTEPINLEEMKIEMKTAAMISILPLLATAALVSAEADPPRSGPWSGDLRSNDDGAAPLSSEGAVLACTDDTSRASRLVKLKHLFTDRSYRPEYKMPEPLDGCAMLQSSITAADVTCTRAGVVFVITPSADRGGDSQARTLLQLGFQKAAIPEFHLFNEKNHDICSAYQKRLEAGERLNLEKWSVILTPQGGMIHFTDPLTGALSAKGRLQRSLFRRARSPVSSPAQHSSPTVTSPLPCCLMP